MKLPIIAKTLTMLVLLCFISITSKAQQTPLPHPRIGINADLIKQLQTLCSNNDPICKNFQDWLALKKTGWTGYTYIGQDADGFLLAYALFHDKAYFDLAWATVSKTVYNTDGTIRLFYDPDCSKAIYCDLHRSAYQGGILTALVAKMLDYGYDQFNDQAKADIITWLNQAATALQANVNAATYFRNDGAITVLGLNSIYLATLGEPLQTASTNDAISTAWHAAWAEQVKALNIMSIGGGMGEGNGYGALTMGQIVNIANNTFYATGEDLFASTPAFKARLAYDAFSVYPKPFYGPGDPFYPSMSPTNEPASIAGDSIRWFAWASLAMQPTGRMLTRHYAGTEEASLWNWAFMQPGTNAVQDPWVAMQTYSPIPALTKPTRLSWFAPGTGMVYVRQNWDNQDATWIASWAGPHYDLHQHLDQGGFGLFKRRDLLPGQTGDYDSSTMGTPHWLQYYSRTPSTNGILIGDPNEYIMGEWAWSGCGPANTQWASIHTTVAMPDLYAGNTARACIPNDGGQRTMMPYSMAIFSLADYTQHRNIYDVAKTLNFSDNGTVVQWVQDLTNAYTNPSTNTLIAGDGSAFVNPSKAKEIEVKRRFVYLRPLDMLLVADTVESTNPAFEKSVVFHSLEKMQQTAPGKIKIVMDDTHPNSKGQITADYRLGFAQAYLQTIFPANASYEFIGGREPSDVAHVQQYQVDPAAKENGHFHIHLKDFYVKDYSEGVDGRPDQHSANWAPTYPANRGDILPSMVGGYGLNRVHVHPSSPQTRDYFLTAVQPSLDPTAVPFTLTSIEADTLFGASFNSGGNNYTITFPKTGDGPATIAVASLAPPAQPTTTTSATTTASVPVPTPAWTVPQSFVDELIAIQDTLNKLIMKYTNPTRPVQ